MAFQGQPFTAFSIDIKVKWDKFGDHTHHRAHVEICSLHRLTYSVVRTRMFKKRDAREPEARTVDFGASTHNGRRLQNQDEIVIPPERTPHHSDWLIFAVADGMGGHAGGCLASKIACNGLVDEFKSFRGLQSRNGPRSISHHLAEAFIRIDRSIRLKGMKDCHFEDMGSTLSCLLVTDTHSIIAHVGDTRIYRLRNGFLSLLTVDHTFVQDMIFEGEVAPENAHKHPLRHLLTRAVGTGEALQLVDCRIDDLKLGDIFLLCSDGLYNTISEVGILKILSTQSSASKTAEELVALAFVKGATDNITAIVVKV